MSQLAGTVLAAAGPVDGATVVGYKASRFVSAPMLNDAPPGGGPDTASAVSGPAFGGHGQFLLGDALPNQDYYVSASFGGIVTWIYFPAVDLFVLDPKEKGGKGDNAHDDTQALLDSVTELVSAGGGKLSLSGIYKHTADIVIPTAVPILIEGVSRMFSGLRPTGAGVNGLVIGSAGADNNNASVRLSKFSILGTGRTAGTLTGIGLTMTRMHGCLVEDMYIGNMGSDGVKLVGSYANALRDLIVQANRGFGIHAIGMAAPVIGNDLVRILDCAVLSHDVAGGGGLLFDGSTGFVGAGISIDKTDIEGNQVGIKVIAGGTAQPENFHVQRCYFENQIGKNMSICEDGGQFARSLAIDNCEFNPGQAGRTTNGVYLGRVGGLGGGASIRNNVFNTCDVVATGGANTQIAEWLGNTRTGGSAFPTDATAGPPSIFEDSQSGSVTKVAFGTWSPKSNYDFMSGDEAAPPTFPGSRRTHVSSDASGFRDWLRKMRGSRSAPAAIQGGDQIGATVAVAFDGASDLTTAFMEFVAQSVAAGNVPTDIIFRTGSGGGAPVETLRLTHDQKVVLNELRTTGPASEFNGDTTAGQGLTSVVGRFAATGQVGNIANTVLFTAPVAGEYEVDVYLVITNAISGSIGVALSWTDETGGQGENIVSVAVAVGHFTAHRMIHSVAGNIDFSTSAPVGTVYDLYIILKRLS